MSLLLFLQFISAFFACSSVVLFSICSVYLSAGTACLTESIQHVVFVPRVITRFKSNHFLQSMRPIFDSLPRFRADIPLCVGGSCEVLPSSIHCPGSAHVLLRQWRLCPCTVEQRLGEPWTGACLVCLTNGTGLFSRFIYLKIAW